MSPVSPELIVALRAALHPNFVVERPLGAILAEQRWLRANFGRPE